MNIPADSQTESFEENYSNDMQNNQFDFYENLASSSHKIYDLDLEFRLKEQIDRDYDNRQEWFSRITSGLSALGLTQSRGSPRQTSSSNEVNTAYLQTYLSLQAQFSDELLKPNNMVTFEVKNSVAMNSNDQMASLGQQLELYGEMAKEDINQKITSEWDDIIPQLERGMASAFLTGSAIFKVYYDEFFNRPVVRFIPPENILIDPETPSLGTAERVTHVYELSDSQLKAYQNSGYFIDIALKPEDGDDDSAQGLRQKRREIAGIQRSEDDVHEFFRFTETDVVYLSMDDIRDPYVINNLYYDNKIKNGLFPYSVSTHKETGAILNITRGWDQRIKHKIISCGHLAHMQFMVGDDFWGLGLDEILIQSHNLATNVQRELTESLRMSNTATAVMSNDVVVKSDSKTIESGTINSVQTSSGMLQGAFMPIPFTPPQPLFYEFLKDIEAKIGSLAGISGMTSQNIPNNIQASVLLALIEKESKPMSGVMKRFVQCINNIFKILKRIMAQDLGQEAFGDGTTGLTNEQVYGNNFNLLSSADPTSSNSALRIVQMQTLLEYAMQNPQLHNMLEVYKRLYQNLKIPNLHQLLLTEEQYAQQQQEQAAQAQEQQKMQQEQAQMQAQQAQQQNMLLEKEMDLKAESEKTDLMIKQQKLENDHVIQLTKIEAEMLKEKGETTKQENIEIAQMYKTHTDFLIDKTKLELDYGVIIPDLIQPKLKAYYDPLEKLGLIQPQVENEKPS